MAPAQRCLTVATQRVNFSVYLLEAIMSEASAGPKLPVGATAFRAIHFGVVPDTG